MKVGPFAGKPTEPAMLVDLSRLVTDYTARVIPHCHGVAVPLEAAQILWQSR